MDKVVNWEVASPLLSQWWNRERRGPVCWVTAPKSGSAAGGFDWWWLARPEADFAEVLAAFERWVDGTWFGGAAMPSMFFNMGPGVLAACFNGYLEYREESETVWFEHPQPWDAVEKLAYQPQGRWMRHIRDAMGHFQERGSGRFLLGMTDLGGGLDILASLRGGENLVYDLLLEPERVEALRARVSDAWFRAYYDLYGIIQRGQSGATAWMGMWAPGTWYPLQCDFSAMMSPELFGEYVVPDLAEQCRRLDYAIYHLDGPNQIPHLDQLLGIPGLDGIQWVPGAGNPQNESRKWYPLYERILERDKLLVLQCWDDAGQVPRLLADFPGARIMCTLGADSEDGGRRMLEWFALA